MLIFIHHKNSNKDFRKISTQPNPYSSRADSSILMSFFTSPPTHSALKLEKKCNFKSTKTHYLHFQKWQKINFCTRKIFKNTKNAIFGLISGAKMDFWLFLKL